MNKTGAGVVLPRAGLFLFGVFWLLWGMGSLAQEAPVAVDASESGEAAAPEIPVDFVPPAPAGERLEVLKTADLATLKAAWDDCNQNLQKLAIQGPRLRMASREAYEDARLDSDISKEIHRQIADLEQQLDQALRNLPEVKDKLGEIQQVEQAMLAEMKLRTTLAGMIAELEKADAESVSE